MMSRIVVHGADNFVGARLVEVLKRENAVAVRPVRAGDAAALSASTLDDAQAVAHCIVGDAAHIERCAALLYGRLTGSKTTPRVVHLSSITVYGSASGVIGESSELLADLGPYSVAQRRAEQVAATASRAVILRSGVEYGPNCAAWSGRVAQWLRSRRLGDLGELGDGLCNLVYIDDLISVFRSALFEPGLEGQVFNVADSRKITWNEYFTAYGVALGAVPVRRIGSRRLQFETRIAAPALRAVQVLSSAVRIPQSRIPSPIPPSLVRLCRQEIDLSVDNVERVLRPQWTPLNLGLSRAADYYA